LPAEAKDIQFLNRYSGGYEDYVYAIFKTKDGSSIFNIEFLNEMNRFSEVITSHESWPHLCLREQNSDIADGYGCTEGSYRNLTAKAKQFLDMVGP
jgi:hypothetical protein